MKNLLVLALLFFMIASCGVDYEELVGNEEGAVYQGVIYVGSGRAPADAQLIINVEEKTDVPVAEARFHVEFEYILQMNTSDHAVWNGDFKEVSENTFEMIHFFNKTKKIVPKVEFSDDKKKIKISCGADGEYGPFEGTLTRTN